MASPATIIQYAAIALVVALAIIILPQVRLGAIIAQESVVTAPEFADSLAVTTSGRCDMVSDTGGLGVILNGRAIESYSVIGEVASVFDPANHMWIGSPFTPRIEHLDTTTSDIFGSSGKFVPMHVYRVSGGTLSNGGTIGGTCRFTWTVNFAAVAQQAPSQPSYSSPVGGTVGDTTGGSLPDTAQPPAAMPWLIWLVPVALFAVAGIVLVRKR